MCTSSSLSWPHVCASVGAAACVPSRGEGREVLKCGGVITARGSSPSKDTRRVQTRCILSGRGARKQEQTAEPELELNSGRSTYKHRTHKIQPLWAHSPLTHPAVQPAITPPPTHLYIHLSTHQLSYPHIHLPVHPVNYTTTSHQSTHPSLPLLAHLSAMKTSHVNAQAQLPESQF